LSLFYTAGDVRLEPEEIDWRGRLMMRGALPESRLSFSVVCWFKLFRGLRVKAGLGKLFSTTDGTVVVILDGIRTGFASPTAAANSLFCLGVREFDE
jgi:hypothetical protein